MSEDRDNRVFTVQVSLDETVFSIVIRNSFI
jgi:hypothetical protein